MKGINVDAYYGTVKAWPHHLPFATSSVLASTDWVEGRETVSAAVWYDSNIDHRLNAIENELAEVKSMAKRILSLLEDDDDVLEARDISFEDAKEEVARYFRSHDGENIDCGDLMEDLNIAPGIIMKVCEKLQEEKKIAPVD
ncbi:MAG: hypothetical protein U5R49_08540 [Deltaproteobacteria bacterium]|nr:hypothetical protein [Deltaproteobacteria bacterium]